MPKQQETFKLVPATLVKSTTPRRPMTSKEAKKAYREASKVPKISKAEQRRIEAEEIARQKKEYEKERAAAKAKATREKKLKKEAEEKVKRKKMGLPEPSRYVRPSQPTIKGFVRTKAGRNGIMEDVDSMVEESTDIGDEISKHGDINCIHKSPPQKSNVLHGTDEEDEFGVFPSLSQVDIPEFSNGTNIDRHSVDLIPSGTNKFQRCAQVQHGDLSSTTPASSCGSWSTKAKRKALPHGTPLHQEGLHVRPFELNQQDDGDEFGDFPSLSQIDVLGVLDTMNNKRRRLEYPDGEMPITSSKSSILAVNICPLHERYGSFKSVERVAEVERDEVIDKTIKFGWPADDGMICKKREEWETQEMIAQEASASGQFGISLKPGIPAKNMNTQSRGKIHQSVSSPTTLNAPNRSSIPASVIRKYDGLPLKPVRRSAAPQMFKTTGDGSTRTPSAPELPSTLNGPRKPLEELSSNMSPPLKSKILKPRGSMLDIGGNAMNSVSSQKAAQKMQPSSFVPPSTLSFLETHFDDFFPSPSQQIRELVEDIDDIPTNTQIAREIELDQPAVKGLPLVIPPFPQLQSISTKDIDLDIMPSQVLKISSKDLGETFTGFTTETHGFQRLTSTARDLSLVEIPNPPPSPELPKTRTKPRFFEEKEEDLLIGALHESLLMVKKQAGSSSPRRSQRIAQNRKEVKVACSNDGYDSDGFETDPDLLAVLDEVELRSFHSSLT